MALTRVTAHFFLTSLLLMVPRSAFAEGVVGCPKDPQVRSREVLFKNGSGVLSGVFVYPPGTGHHPTLLFLYGSSSAARDGRGLFPPIWCSLARQGVASLSWDRPGVGGSTGDATKLDWLAGDRALEAQAAISFAKLQPEVDPSDIGLLGISQAGWIIPQIVRREPSISRVVMLSAPVSTVWKQTRYIVDRHLELRGRSKEERQDVAQTLSKIELLLHSDRTYRDYLSLATKYRSRGWLAVVRQLPQGDYFALDEDSFNAERRDTRRDQPTDLGVLKMPVLAIYGTQDLNVDPLAGAAAFVLLRASNPNVRILLLPGVDHFMRYAPAIWPIDRPAALPTPSVLAASEVAPEMLMGIVGWFGNTHSP